jgi:hypothetical protein
VYDNTGVNDYFAYKTFDATAGTKSIYSIFGLTRANSSSYAYAGLRFDNPSAPTTNFIELILLPSATAGFFKLKLKYNNGGGEVTNDYADGLPVTLWTLRLSYILSGPFGTFYYGDNSPAQAQLAAVTLWSSNDVRGGMIFGNVGASGAVSRAALVDLWIG